MDKKRITSKYLILLGLLIITIMVAIGGKIETSTTVAKYRTIINSNKNTTTVAKWDIKDLKRKGAEVSMLGDGFKISEIGDSGNWFYEINNASNVVAKLESSSKIRFRIDSNNFTTTIDNWNFLEGNNPITFEISLYNCGLDSILSYQNKYNSTIKNINEYDNLTDEEKKDYNEIIDSNQSSMTIMSTLDNVSFVKKTEETKVGAVDYYYADYDFSHIDLEKLILGFNQNDSITFRISWKVASHTVKKNKIEEGVYNLYKLYKAEELNQDYSIYETYTIDNQEYVIACRKLNYFQYMNYLSTQGAYAEPNFIFPNPNGVINSFVKIPYSKLSLEQKAQIEQYSPGNSVIGLEQYIEKLTLKEYENFLEYQKLFENNLGYLEYGLSCRIIFNLKISQVN